MAKKKEKSSSKDEAAKKDGKAKGGKPTDSVFSAIEQAFAAATGGAMQTRGRAQDLVEDIASATSRVRETLDDLRVLEDLRGLRAEVETLATRVAALEVQQAVQADAASKPATRRSSSATPSGSASRSSTAGTATPRASAGTKPAGTRAAKGTSPRSRATPGTRKPAGSATPKAPPTDPAPDASAGRS